MPRTAIVIPARYGSTRLPGKPLLMLGHKPIIQHVWERACHVPEADEVWVATDDERIASCVSSFGGKVLMTSPHHPSGTDRLCEAAQRLRTDFYINLQGDEPFIRPQDISLLVQAMHRAGDAFAAATLAHILPPHEAPAPHHVKVVLDANGRALYFSRAPIPFHRDGFQGQPMPPFLKHLGIYAYRSETLAAWPSLPIPPLEEAEKLEQLRLLHAGMAIKVLLVDPPEGPGIDTPECLQTAQRLLHDNPGLLSPQPA